MPMSNNLIEVDYKKVRKAYIILKSLNKKWTQKILKVIAEERQITVTGIYTKLNLFQSVTSRRLADLRKAGIVSVLQAGTLMYYSINYKRLDAIEIFLKDLLDQFQ